MIESAEEFVRLRSSRVVEEYHRAAHEEASPEVWYDVIERFPDYRKWVAHNKTIQLEILEYLSDDPDERVRDMVAMKRKLSHSLFAKLAKDADEGVRHNIAVNANTPDDVLRMLVNGTDEFTRESARTRLGMPGS